MKGIILKAIMFILLQLQTQALQIDEDYVQIFIR